MGFCLFELMQGREMDAIGVMLTTRYVVLSCYVCFLSSLSVFLFLSSFFTFSTFSTFSSLLFSSFSLEARSVAFTIMLRTNSHQSLTK